MGKYSVQAFEKGLEELKLSFTSKQIEQFITFYELLVEWNKVMNLTGITEYEEVISKHFLDSLLIVKAYSMENVKNFIDIGTGAGFPGIPLKIAYPETECVLMDSLGKRIKFLEAVVDNLQLSGIELVHARAEDLAKQEKYREKFEVSVSRAVANLSSLSEYCIPFVSPKGVFISYKSGEVTEEMQQAKKAVGLLGGRVESCKELVLPGTDIVRSFVIVRKESCTPRKYPRKAGLPTKEPLGM